jgi:hypothetical protein
MAEPRTPTPKKPQAPRTPADLLKSFKTWAEGRYGLGQEQLIELFAASYNLSAADLKTLRDTLNKEAEAAKKAAEAKATAEEAKKKAAVKPGLIISRTKYPKWWKDLQVWPISINGPGTWPVISKSPGFLTFVATIALTVSDETNIVLTFGVFGASGSMDFGGTDEPRGIVIPMGESPAPCGEGGFTITSDGAAATIGGLVVYYQEKVEVPKA